MPADVIAELESRGHRIYVIGDNHVQGGFASFASPVAIVRDVAERDEQAGSFRAGVDTMILPLRLRRGNCSHASSYLCPSPTPTE